MLNTESGLYAGVWASNVNWTTEGGYMDDNSLRLMFMVVCGNRLPFGGIGFDIGVLQVLLPR